MRYKAMKSSTLLARLCAAAVLAAPLSLPGTLDVETINELKLTKYVEPPFPDGLRFEGVAKGSVTLAVSRNRAGKPIDILIIGATHPKLADAAVRAVREWRFAPAESDSATDLAPKLVRIGFKLEGVVLIFPFGKNHEEETLANTSALSLRSPLTVPQLQTLRQVPKALVQPMPAYPAALARKGLEGTATVGFYVDQEGRVRMPVVIEATTPEFAQAALAAVAQWRYEPPRKDGRSIVARDHWEFKFQAVN